MTMRELLVLITRRRRIRSENFRPCLTAIKRLLPEGIDTDIKLIFCRKAMKRFRKWCETHHGPATHNKDRRHYFTAWKRAYQWKLIDYRPRRGEWPAMRVPKKAPRAFTRAEIARMFSQVEKMPWSPRTRSAMSAFLAVSYFTGVRRVHIMEAPRDAIDEASGTLRITDTKTMRERVFKLPPDVAQVIIKGRAGSRIHPRYRYLIALNSPSERFAQLCLSAGIQRSQGQGLHALRRSCGTHIAAAAGIAAAAEHLGHRSTRVTLDSYIDPSQVPVHSHCGILDVSVMWSGSPSG